MHLRLRERSVWLSVLSFAALLALWQTAGALGWLRDNFLPTLGEVVRAGIQSAGRGDLSTDLASSLSRVVPGVLLGSMAGSLVGMLSAQVRWISRVLAPLLHMGRALPAVALAPLFIKLMGIDEVSKITIIALGVFFPVWVSTHVGAGLVRQKYRDLEEVYELGRVRRLMSVSLPATLPFIVSGIRIGLGIAFAMLFIAEWIASDSGVGYRISLAHTVGRGDVMILGLIELGLLAFLADFLFDHARRKLLPWLEHANA